MRILMLLAVVCLAVAFIGAANIVNGVNVLAWFIGGMLVWAVDVTIGSAWTIPISRRS